MHGTMIEPNLSPGGVTVVPEGMAVTDVLPAIPKVPKGIAILGSHPATVMQAPFDDDWLIYACSPHNYEKRQLPRHDAWFEVHIPLTDQTRAYDYLKYLETLPLVWMRDQAAIKHFPGAKLYPEREMIEKFGPFFLDTSSIAYMLAKAISDCEEHGIKQIGMWGIMQASPNEYQYQRPGIQYFIQMAVNRGIKVLCPPESKLFEPQQVKF